MKVLKRDFFERDAVVVAREIIGKKLVRDLDGEILSGMIIEAEAYRGLEDSASHAFQGKTPRNSIMFGPAGVAYVYFIYGMYYLLNIVTEEEGIPSAVLIRAILPLEGLPKMEELRNQRGKNLTNGPGKLCQALSIDKRLNGWDMTRGEKLWVEEYKNIPASQISSGPRVGIDYANKRDREAPWRFISKVE